jgi:hypothetical protein
MESKLKEIEQKCTKCVDEEKKRIYTNFVKKIYNLGMESNKGEILSISEVNSDYSGIFHESGLTDIEVKVMIKQIKEDIKAYKENLHKSLVNIMYSML